MREFFLKGGILQICPFDVVKVEAGFKTQIDLGLGVSFFAERFEFWII